MSFIDSIKQPVLSEFLAFEEEFKTVFESDNPLLSLIIEHILKGKGKQLRPILVLLAAKLCGRINPRTIDVAISLELLHNASLIHDDVVDETFERRGNPSINAKWDNKISILAGDYMLSNSLSIAVKTKNLHILNLISTIGKELSDGELLQLSNTEKSILTEEKYLQIISKKTALLFAVCTESGAVSVNANDDQRKALHNFGKYLGICFQIQDDIFDYSENANIGKPIGNDIREGKVTLPLILALKHAPKNSTLEISKIIDNKYFTVDNVNKIIYFTRENQGISLAHDYMNKYKSKAIEELNSFKNSDVKSALLLSLEYTSKRSK